jgi:hypothetical protein
LGEDPNQGVGYLEDGTMVVIEGANDKIGRTVTFAVTSALQTSAGRMIFGKYEGDSPPRSNDAGNNSNGGRQGSSDSRRKRFNPRS